MSTSTENANQELRAILMQELELQRQELQWQYRRVLDLNAVVLQNAGRLEIIENYLSNPTGHFQARYGETINTGLQQIGHLGTQYIAAPPENDQEEIIILELQPSTSSMAQNFAAQQVNINQELQPCSSSSLAQNVAVQEEIVIQELQPAVVASVEDNTEWLSKLGAGSVQNGLQGVRFHPRIERQMELARERMANEERLRRRLRRQEMVERAQQHALQRLERQVTSSIREVFEQQEQQMMQQEQQQQQHEQQQQQEQQQQEQEQQQEQQQQQEQEQQQEQQEQQQQQQREQQRENRRLLRQHARDQGVLELNNALEVQLKESELYENNGWPLRAPKDLVWADECVICTEAPAVMYPVGCIHVHMCPECAVNAVMAKTHRCPMCRAVINNELPRFRFARR